MAKFEKGISGNPQGRPKGVKDKITLKIYESFAKLIEECEEGLQADMMELEPKDRIDAILKLAAFFIPKAVTNINVESAKPITIEAKLRELAEKEIRSKN